MSKFDNLNIGDVIIVTGIDENLLECDRHAYDTLLGVMQQPCEVLDIKNDIMLWSDCKKVSQKGVLIKNPKLQGHDGGGRCPEFNCYWIGRDYVNFELLSYNETTDILDKLNESENEFDWVKDIKLSLGFDDLKIGDVVKLKDYDNNNWEITDIYMSDPNMTGKPSEKRVKFKTPFKNSYLELWKSPLNSNDYFELVNRNPDRVYFNVNESEESEIFKEISHEDLEVGTRVVVNGDADPWGKDGGNIKFNNELGKVVYNWNEDEEDTSNAFTIAFDNWDKGHNGGNMLTDVCGVNKCWSFYDDCAYSGEGGCENISKLQFYIINSYDLFDQLNESDEFGWAKDIVKNILDVVDYRTVKQGDKVVPGKDWEFGNQAKGSVYGIVDLEQYEGVPSFIDDSTDEEFHQYWVHVDWVDKNDNPNFRNNYRVGPNYYDLKYYVPKPINIKESVDDFDWVKDIVNSDLKFGSVKGDLKIGDVITITGDIIDTDGTLLVDLDEEPFLVVKNNKFELYGHIYKPGEYSYRIELNWFNPNSKRPSNWQRASMHSDDGKDIISFTDDLSEWDDGLIVKFLKK